ncbi:RecQ family ATP-dependent DNA helicase [Anaerolineales bacterium HSG24]|nr:RecQ family ATP-dependent DNA helicase [Anaerolineales bacterium HSG24]
MTPKEALKQYFGFDEFREGQEVAINRVLKGQETLLVMPTGSGKSLGYQLPGLMLPGLTLVISPLIALMKDQVDSLVQAGISATYINSSLPGYEANERMRAVREGHVKLLYVAPERLRNNRFMRVLANIKISLLAIDEAHCVSQWGHDFRPDYLRIGPTWQALGRPTLLATTATATPAVQKQIVQLLGLKKARIIVAGFNRPNLSFSVKYTPDDNIKLQTLQSILRKIDTGSSIVYTSTRRNTDEVADFIRQIGIPAQAYHAGLERNIRYQVQDEFMADKIKVVVATNAFGMGVDKANVRVVIHYNIPSSVEAYYQESGRAGRDGLPANCTLFFSPNDQGLQEFLIKSDIPTYEDMEQLYKLLANSTNDGETQATIGELSDHTNMFPTKVRVALSELEQAGLIINLGMEGFVNRWRMAQFSRAALNQRNQAIQARKNNRFDLLNTMLNYAKLTRCRRKFLLNYFGDVTPPKSPRCCDNHQEEEVSDLPKAATPEEWYPLIILETANSLPRLVGRVLLADVLVGSQAAKVTRFGYNRHKFYGKLGGRLSKKQVVSLIDSLISNRYMQIAGNEKPVIEASELGLEAIKHRASLPVSIPTTNGTRPKPSITTRSRKRGQTLLDTLDLFKQGLSPIEIASERGINENTVYSHFAQLIEAKKVTINEILPIELEKQIVEAIALVGDTDVMFPIKAILPEEISYNHIRCVIAAYGDSVPKSLQPAQLPSAAENPIKRIAALGNTKDSQHLPELIQAMQHADGKICRLAALALGKIGDPQAVQPLLFLLSHDKDPQNRRVAVKSLGKLADHRARAVLEQIASNDDERDYVKHAARTALERM